MRFPVTILLLSVFAAACQQPTAAPADAAETAAAPGAARVAYVNTDSIISGYTYLRQQTEILGKREQEASANLERKLRSFQEQVQGFQRRVQSGNMTPKASENEQRVLANKEQELAAEQQRLAAEFQGEGLRLQNELTITLQREVEAIRAAEGYDYILTYGSGSNVLAVNEAYDITDAVLGAMNAAPTPNSDSTAVQ